MDAALVLKAVRGALIVGAAYLCFVKERFRKSADQWDHYLSERHKIEENQRRALMEEIQLLGETAPHDADSHKLVQEAARKIFDRM